MCTWRGSSIHWYPCVVSWAMMWVIGCGTVFKRGFRSGKPNSNSKGCWYGSNTVRRWDLCWRKTMIKYLLRMLLMTVFSWVRPLVKSSNNQPRSQESMRWRILRMTLITKVPQLRMKISNRSIALRKIHTQTWPICINLNFYQTWFLATPLITTTDSRKH
jgi:hypothetical protein